MRRLLFLTSAALLLATGAMGQSVAEYLKLRRSHGITKAITPDKLDSIVGERVVEVRGTVKGTFRVGDQGSLMIERPDGGVQVVDCDMIPEWLVGNEVKTRLLVRVIRQDEASELSANLIAAAPEADVAAHEPKPTLAKSAKAVLAKPKKEWILPASQVTPIYASFIQSRNRRLSNAQAMEIAHGIVGFSLHYGVDARLIMAMVMVESGFNPEATSRVGAMGLGQLMPGTARGLGVANPYDAMENLYGAVKLLRGHLVKYKNQTGQDYASLVLALAAYNAGGGAVSRHGGVPPYRETQNYIRKVIGVYMALCGQKA